MRYEPRWLYGSGGSNSQIANTGADARIQTVFLAPPAPNFANSLARKSAFRFAYRFTDFGSRLWGDRNKRIPNSLQNPKILVGVESRRGAVAWALWASLRFLSPLIKPDVRISRIRLPDRLHLKAHGGGPRWTRLCRITPSSPNTTVSGKPGATRRHLMAPDQEMTYSLVRSSSLIPDNQFGSPAPPSP